MRAFDEVSGEYGEKSVIQRKAGRKLLELLELGADESVLDVGCGPGHLTGLISGRTSGRVAGADISGGMIAQACHSYPSLEFVRVPAEELDFEGEFDVVYCNSTLQWLEDAQRAVEAMRRALKPGGKLGVCCPSTPEFAPLFDSVVRAVAEHPEIATTFAHWRKPWWHLPDIGAYREFFERAGFTTAHIELAYEADSYTVEEAYGVFSTGAARGFVGEECYDVPLSDDYVRAFERAARREMERRSEGGVIVVDFNRLYYVGRKT